MDAGNKIVRNGVVAEPDCRILADILADIGDRWTVMVIGALSHGPMRYNALRKTIGGISQRMLTLALKGLEQNGFVHRVVFPTVPPGVQYELSELGRSLIDPLTNLFSWAKSRRPEINQARKTRR